MGKKNGTSALYDEEERRNFLLGFHSRKQQRKVDYLTKKALNEKKNRALEKIARRRNLIKREKELGLLDDESEKKTMHQTEEHMKDNFSKNMFGTEEVTVTVECSDEDTKPNEEEAVAVSDEALLNDNEVEEEEEDLDAQEQEILENIKLSDKELRQIHEQAAKKNRKGKSNKRNLKRKKSHHK